MDILISSNLERLLFFMASRGSEAEDAALVASLMAQLKETGRYTLPNDMLERIRAQFLCGRADDDAAFAAIRDMWQNSHYLMDTHTAVASAVLRAYQKETGDARRSVIVSTASPYKFGASVLGAVAGQVACAGLDDFACCRALAERTGTKEPEQIRALPNLPIRHTAVCEKDAMEQAVLEQIRA